ncbi:MAG: hypothetical protein ACYTHM_08800, partial [Planctomycetota bacterium]
ERLNRTNASSSYPANRRSHPFAANQAACDAVSLGTFRSNPYTFRQSRSPSARFSPSVRGE